MDKNYRQYNKRASMDSIEVPDVDKIKKLSDKKFKGSGVNRTADEILTEKSSTRQGSSTVPQRLTMTLPSTRKRTMRTISLRTLRLCLHRRRQVLARE